MKHLKKINEASVILLEADSNYTYIHLENGEKLVSSFTLGRHQAYFPAFLRVNRKYLLNPHFITEFVPDKYRIKISGRWYSISRRRKDIFNDYVN